VKTIRVKTKPPYTVVIGEGALGKLPSVLRNVSPSKVVIVSSPRVRKHWGTELERVLRATRMPSYWIEVPDGEQHKTLRTVEAITRSMARAGADRRSVVIAFGGGVVGDMAGFAAATFMRGISLIQLPTTLLGQVDASVGGKTGVDLPEGKNLLGAFHQPKAVIVDLRFLSTLPSRQFRAGLFEVLKCGFIADRSLLGYCERHREEILRCEPDALLSIVSSALQVKAKIVAADERESGQRRILNFGHTIGHAIEAATRYRSLLHGEAVAWGIIAAAEIGANVGVTRPDHAERIVEAVMAFGPLPPVTAKPREVLSRMKADKKNVYGIPHFVLVPEVGSAKVVKGVDPRIVRAAVEGICQA
jgi:3-dehydroquinate synthase